MMRNSTRWSIVTARYNLLLFQTTTVLWFRGQTLLLQNVYSVLLIFLLHFLKRKYVLKSQTDLSIAKRGHSSSLRSINRNRAGGSISCCFIWSRI